MDIRFGFASSIDNQIPRNYSSVLLFFLFFWAGVGGGEGGGGRDEYLSNKICKDRKNTLLIKEIYMLSCDIGYL